VLGPAEVGGGPKNGKKNKESTDLMEKRRTGKKETQFQLN